MRIFDQICISLHILEKFERMKLNVEVQCDIFRERKNLEFGKMKNWYFVTKIVPTYCEKNCSSDQDFFLKFEAKG